MNRNACHFGLAAWKPVVRCALALAFSLAAAQARAAVGCYLTCVGDSPRCEVARGNEAKPLEVPKGSFLPVAQCDAVTRLTGKIAGVVRVNGKSYDIRAENEGALRAQLARHANSACLVTETACRTERDLALLSGRAGKPFDGSTQVGPVGQPCGMGFPCGLVRVPAGSLVVQIEDRSYEGTVVVSAVRGASGALRLPVARGRFEVPASLLVHGASYTYAASRDSGPVFAAGTFSLASDNMMADAEEDRREALAAGLGEPVANLKALLRNNFDWDLYVWIRDQAAK